MKPARRYGAIGGRSPNVHAAGPPKSGLLPEPCPGDAWHPPGILGALGQHSSPGPGAPLSTTSTISAILMAHGSSSRSNEALQIISRFCLFGFLLKYRATGFQEKEEGERAGLFSCHFKNKADLKAVCSSNKAREIPAPKKLQFGSAVSNKNRALK